MIAVLCGTERQQWIAPGLMMSLVQAITEAMRTGRPVALELIKNVRPVDAARNEAARRFLQSDCEWLVQVDNDTIPPPNFLDVIELAEQDAKYVVGLPCPFLCKDAGLLWNVGKQNGDHWDLLNN